MIDFVQMRAAVGGNYPTREELLADPSLPVPFVASTPGMKDDGYDLRKDKWDLSRFRQHGPILVNHNTWGEPIGLGEPYFEGEDLMIRCMYDQDDPDAMRIRSKAIKGLMRGSVAWYSKGEPEERNVLYEFSMVTMPMDLNSKAAVRARIVGELPDEAEKLAADIAQRVAAHMERNMDEDEDTVQTDFDFIEGIVTDAVERFAERAGARLDEMITARFADVAEAAESEDDQEDQPETEDEADNNTRADAEDAEAEDEAGIDALLMEIQHKLRGTTK